MKKKLIAISLMVAILLSVTVFTGASNRTLEYRCGDVDGDATITISDALEVLKYLASLPCVITDTSNVNQKSAWRASLITEDSRSNNEPAIGDVLEMLKLLASLASTLDECNTNIGCDLCFCTPCDIVIEGCRFPCGHCGERSCWHCTEHCGACAFPKDDCQCPEDFICPNCEQRPCACCLICGLYPCRCFCNGCFFLLDDCRCCQVCGFFPCECRDETTPFITISTPEVTTPYDTPEVTTTYVTPEVTTTYVTPEVTTESTTTPPDTTPEETTTTTTVTSTSAPPTSPFETTTTTPPRVRRPTHLPEPPAGAGAAGNSANQPIRGACANPTANPSDPHFCSNHGNSNVEICHNCSYCLDCEWKIYGVARCSSCHWGGDCLAHEDVRIDWCGTCNTCRGCCGHSAADISAPGMTPAPCHRRGLTGCALGAAVNPACATCRWCTDCNWIGYGILQRATNTQCNGCIAKSGGAR